MTSREPAMSEAHFSGINTRLIIEHLRDKMAPGTLDAVLERAGETRSMDVLLDDTKWTSYSQMRRLLVATGEVMGGPRSLAPIGRDARVLSESVPEMLASVRGTGLASCALRRDRRRRRRRPRQHRDERWLGDRQQRVDADPAVLRRLRTHPRILLAARRTARDAAPPLRVPARRGDRGAVPGRRRPQMPLPRSVAGDRGCRPPRRTLREPGPGTGDASRRTPPNRRRHRLRREHRLGAHPPRRHRGAHRRGTRTRAGPARHADCGPTDLLARSRRPRGGEPGPRTAADDVPAAPGRLVVDVASTQRHYGKLAAVDRDGRAFFPHDRVTLDIYASLAASALDSAAALAAAQSEATTAHALLELSTSLAEIVTIEEVAIKLARAVPAVVDCDRSLVCLFDADGLMGTIAASYGYPPEMESFFQGFQFDLGDEPPAIQGMFHDRESAEPLIANFLRESGTVAAISVPIIANGVALGRVVASVAHTPERLQRDPNLAGRLLALSGQAATAIGNARLLERIRHQALHDALTGLPNRVLDPRPRGLDVGPGATAPPACRRAVHRPRRFQGHQRHARARCRRPTAPSGRGAIGHRVARQRFHRSAGRRRVRGAGRRRQPRRRAGTGRRTCSRHPARAIRDRGVSRHSDHGHRERRHRSWRSGLRR